MIITSVLPTVHQNPTSSLWEILLTNKQTNKQTKKETDKKFWPHRGSNSRPDFLAQCFHRLSYRAVLIWLLESEYYYSPNSPNFIQIWPVVLEKQFFGSHIRISIRITPNFELGLLMIITSVLSRFLQNPTSSLWETLLTNQQTKKQTKFSGHTEVRTLDPCGFSTMILPTEL